MSMMYVKGTLLYDVYVNDVRKGNIIICVGNKCACTVQGVDGRFHLAQRYTT